MMSPVRHLIFFLGILAACSPPAVREKTGVEPAACNPRDPWSCRDDGLFCVERQGRPACMPNTCGNGEVESPEECDGPDAVSCASWVGGAGRFVCGSDCRWDYSGCERCGNGLLNGLEECDGVRFSVSCEDFGYASGVLECLPSCRVSTQACKMRENGG